jgi:atypical dual specificity phosphatase
MLVGLPGSGKSFFSENISKIDPNVVIISQDTLGSKSKCEQELMKAVKSGKKVIIDKCNPTIADRQYWADYSMISKNDTVIIHFDYPVDECVNRVKDRVGHPTIKFGHGENVVKTFAKQLQVPTEAEGYKKIIKIGSFDECNSFLIKLGCDPNKLSAVTGHTIIKFPRTHHIFDAGGSGVSRDDLVLNDSDVNDYINCALTLEEKVDGANLGISIDKEYKIAFQNRSHYVTYNTSTQFKALQQWQEIHEGDLFSILEPNRHILYGEWCYAKHSIEYTDLPGYFLAFDIFDKKENKFYSRKKFHEEMSKTSIPMVPIIDTVTFSNKTEMKDRLTKYLDTKSVFRDGPVEGVYIRKDDGEWLQKRCKLVRPDFIQGIDEHWTKKELVKNRVRY